MITLLAMIRFTTENTDDVKEAEDALKAFVRIHRMLGQTPNSINGIEYRITLEKVEHEETQAQAR